MDPYLWLRFAHLVGLMLISAGLIGVFIADMRSRQVRDVRLFAASHQLHRDLLRRPRRAGRAAAAGERDLANSRLLRGLGFP